jgi:hypothetical protein
MPTCLASRCDYYADWLESQEKGAHVMATIVRLTPALFDRVPCLFEDIMKMGDHRVDILMRHGGEERQ